MSGVFLGATTAKLFLGETPILTGDAVLTTKTITENGTYNALTDNADGYSSVTVDVPSAGVLTTKTVTVNGTYSAEDDDADGYSGVTVDVPQPVVSSFSAAADLTHYESGQTDLGNGFTITSASGITGVGAKTVDGVQYIGLGMSGAANFKSTRELSDRYSVAEFDVIVAGGSGDMRIVTTGGLYFDMSVWASTSHGYLILCDYEGTILDTAHLVNIGDHNCKDTSLPLSSLINTVLRIKYVSDGEYVTLYVNDVSKIKWTLAKANAQISTYGLNVGANGMTTPTMLAVKAEYSGELLEWDGKTWIVRG